MKTTALLLLATSLTTAVGAAFAQDDAGLQSFNIGTADVIPGDVSRFDGDILVTDTVVTGAAADGRILIGQMILEDSAILDALSLASMGECAAEDATGEVLLGDIQLVSDGDTISGSGRTPESITIDRMYADVSIAGCMISVSGAFREAVLESVAGDTMGVSAGEYVYVGGSDTAQARYEIRMSQLSFDGPDGNPVGMSLEEVHLVARGAAARPSIDGGSLESGFDLADIIAAGNSATEEFGIRFSGLDIDVDTFLSESDREDLGLMDVDRISGGGVMAAKLADGQIEMRFGADIPELVVGEYRARLALPEDGVEVPGMIADRVPLPPEMLGMKLIEITGSFNDHGIGAVMERTIGLTPESAIMLVSAPILERVGRLASQGTVDMTEQAIDVMVDISRNGGSFMIAPEDPVSFIEIGIKALMQPGAMQNFLGATAAVADASGVSAD